MSSNHANRPEGLLSPETVAIGNEAELLRQAQGGCRASLNQLMAAYESRVAAIVACQGGGRLSVAERLQAGREGLWQAIVVYDPAEERAFWATAWPTISTTIWQRVKEAEWRQRRLSPILVPLAEAEREDLVSLWATAPVEAALAEMVTQLPVRLQQVVTAYYGLDGQPPRSSRQIGQDLGLSRQRIWQLRQEALARLSHPSASYQLRCLLGAHRLADYLAAQRRVRAWLRQRGGRRRETDDGQRP